MARPKSYGLSLGWPMGPGQYAPAPGSLLAFLSRIVYAGDSITAFGNGDTPTSKATETRGYSTWTQMQSKQIARMPFGGNAGVSGNTSTQLLARYETDVLSKSPRIVVLLIATNDVNGASGGNGATVAATANANIAAMLALNVARGIKTIILKVLPRGSVGSPMTADQITAWQGINNYIGGLTGNLIKVIDAEGILGNLDAAHTVKTTHFDADFVHPNATGAQALGLLVSREITTTVSGGDVLFQSNTDPLNYVTNGFMEGAGPIATGWSAAHTANGATITPSVVARSDGKGNWQQLAISGSVSPGGGFARIRRSLFLTGLLNAGDTVQIMAEIEGDPGIVNIEAASLQLAFGSVNLRANNRQGTIPAPDGPWSGVAMSPPYTLEADAATPTIDLFVWFSLSGTGAISANIRFGRVALVKV